MFYREFRGKDLEGPGKIAKKVALKKTLNKTSRFKHH